MIYTEAFFLECENCPPEMIEHFDRPWKFVAEVRGWREYINTTCKKCNKPRPVQFLEEIPTTIEDIRYHLVAMKAYHFITDDLIEVTVYFGVCSNCSQAHWARQGPPFKRLRSYVGMTLQ